MPSRFKRFHQSGQTHFLTFSCYHKALLNSMESRRICNAKNQPFRGSEYSLKTHLVLRESTAPMTERSRAVRQAEKGR